MKTRESGMPDEEMWQTYFSPSQTLLALDLRGDMSDVAELPHGNSHPRSRNYKEEFLLRPNWK
jgi:hypothetical protein